MTFRWRLVSWYLAILILLLAAFAATVYLVLSHLLLGEAERGAQALGVQVQHLVADTEGDRAVGMDLADAVLADQLTSEGLYLEIRNVGRKLESRSRNLGNLSLQPPGGWPDSRSRIIALPRLGRILVVRVPLLVNGRPVGTALAGHALASEDLALAALRRVFAASLVAACLIAGLGGYLFIGFVLRPIDRITRTARRIGAESLGERLRLGGPDDELTRLASAFDEMLDRLEDAFAREQRFVADAAHELRTPLAVMKTNLEVALRQGRSARDYRAVLEALREETERLSRLAEDLLWLARSDAPHPPPPGPVALDSLVLDTVDRLAATAARKQITFDTARLEPVEVDGDAERLQRALFNVLDNAVKYTPPTGRVTVAVRYTGAGAEMSVHDTGPGIAAEHLPHVFERFYRADAARSRRDGGAGLGLAIARELIEAEGGELRAESRPGEGSTFVFTFPAGWPSAPKTGEDLEA